MMNGRRLSADAMRLDTEALRELMRRRAKPVLRRALLHASAVAVALVCAAALVNYVVMPIIVKRGDLVAAPDLVGLPIVEARRVTDEVGLCLRVDTEAPDPLHPAGHVVRQVPDPGVEIKRGRTVALVLSAGLDSRVVPALGGLTERQAQLEAERVGLAVSDIVEVFTDRVERGRVVGTDPGHGAAVPAGTGLRILVSLGAKPRELVMPLLIGKSPEEARLVAETLGLVVRSVKYEGRRSRILRDVVVVQDPVAGSRVVEGEGVTLRVGKG